MKRLILDRTSSHQVSRQIKLWPTYGGNRSGSRFLSKVILLLIIATAAVTTTLAPMAVHPEDTVSPRDIDGWRNTRWGMTEAEVEAALPGEVVRFTAPDKHGSTETSLRIMDFELAGDRFTVHLDFESVTRRLNRVTLDLKEDNHLIAEGAFHKLEQALTEKYGSATYRKERGHRGSLGLSRENKATWRLNKTIIELRFLYFENSGHFLYLTYMPLSAQKSLDEKL